MGKNQLVTSEETGWAVKTEGSAQPFAVFKTQSDAWERAKAIARKERSEAILYGRNGLVRARSTMATTPAARAADLQSSQPQAAGKVH